MSYLTRVKHVKEELVGHSEKIEDDELVKTTLNGFNKEWNVFIQVIKGRQDLTNWKILWSYFSSVELRRSLVNSTNNSC